LTDLSYSDLPVSGDTNNASDVITPLNEIKSYVNSAGWVDSSRIVDGTVTDTDLASPNNSVYKTILTAPATILALDAAAATYALDGTQDNDGAPYVSGTATTVGSGDVPAIPLIYFDDADYTVGSKTTKLRLRAQVNTNATAWSSVTATFGLYPVTFAGAADTLTITLGTVVSGSTVAIANPSASTTNQGNSGDFTIPSDGQYCIGVVTSATLTNNAAALLTAQLQTRNV
jgi:hypothetical protein